MKREHSYSYCGRSKGIAVVPLIFGVMLLGILGVAISWEVYNAQVSSVDVPEMHQVYAVAQSGIEFAIRYASDSQAQRRALYSPGQTRTLPSSGSFPGGRFTVIFNPSTDTLTSTATLIGSSAKRELALMNFRSNYVRPDFADQFDEPSSAQSFDQRYFAVARGGGAATTVLSGIDDPSQPWLEQAFTVAGESNPDIGARGGFFKIGFPWDIFVPGEQEYIMIFPTTPGTGKLTINGLERTGLPVDLDEEGYQNYSVEVKFSLSPAIPQPDQGFGIIFRLHHPTLPLGGPWSDTDLDYTLFYALQMEPHLGLSPNGGFFVRWWARDPSTGRGTNRGLCGGSDLYFNEDYCKEQELTPAGLVDVYKGGYFFPENPDYATCDPSAPNDPGWGWNDSNSNWSFNPWIDCNRDAKPDMHILRVDVFKNKFTVYFGTERGIKCDNTDSFVLHKIMEIDVAEERARRGNCVPDYRTGHIGLRAWNGFQAQVDYIKVWRQ
jgi:hypothetical protein